MSAADAGAKGAGRRAVVYTLLLAALGAALAIRWVSGREPGVTWTQAPPETHGIWKTRDARYAGRTIEVGPGSVTLGIGDQGSVPGRLVIAREFYDDDERVLRLEYETAEGPDAIEMVLSEQGSTMFLRNQPEIVWAADRSAGYRPPPPVTLPSDQPVDLTPYLLNGLLLTLLGVAVWLLVRSVGMSSGGADPAGVTPRAVRGVWTTPDPRFEGRSIRIAYEYGFAQFGPGDVRIGGEITDVKRWREDGSQVVSLTYRTREGIEKALDMAIDRAGHMRLKDGPQSIWVRR